MVAVTNQMQAPKSGMRKWMKRLLWLSLIPAIAIGGYYLLYTYFFVIGGTISSAELADTDSCGAGDYRLLEYKYRNGDGYLHLVDRNGKVLDSSKFSHGTDIGPIGWSKDCQTVNVGSDEGRVILEVKR